MAELHVLEQKRWPPFGDCECVEYTSMKYERLGRKVANIHFQNVKSTCAYF